MRKRYSVKWRYWAWLLLAIRLLLPVNFTLPQAPVRITPPTQQVAVFERTASDPASAGAQDGLATQPPAGAPAPGSAETGTPIQPTRYPVSVLSCMAIVWLAGAVFSLLWQGFCRLRFTRTVLRWNQPVEEPELLALYQKLCAELSIRRSPALCKNRRIHSPMLVGLLHPCILLPQAAFSLTDYDVVLRHELTHYRRGDLWYKLVLLLAGCVHWPNPMMLVLMREAAGDLEISCDEAAVRTKDEEFRQKYCEVILRTLRRGVNQRLAFSTSFGGSKRTLKRRFEAVLTGGKRRGVALVALTAAVLAVCGMLFACGGEIKPETAGDAGSSAAESDQQSRPETDGSSEETAAADIHYLPLEPVAIDSQPLNRLETVQSRAREYGVDLSGWTQLYAYDGTDASNILTRVAVYEKPQGTDTAAVTAGIVQLRQYEGVAASTDIPQHIDRVVVEYVRFRERDVEYTPEKNYWDEAVLCFYDESEARFGGFEHAKRYQSSQGGLWQYSFFNPDTGVTLCCAPAYHIAIAVNNYGDGPFLHSYKQYPSTIDQYGGRYYVLMVNESMRLIDGFGENYCYDVAVYDTKSNRVTIIGTQLPGAYCDYPAFLDENAGYFILCTVYNNAVHNQNSSMSVYDPANPTAPVAVLDASILPALPQGATRWCINPMLAVDDRYAVGAYALMFYPDIPGEMPETVDGVHSQSGVNWHIATLDHQFRVTETVDTGLAMWGTEDYCSPPADVILRDGLLYFSYYFNVDNVFQRERWVYNVIHPAHGRQLLETTMPQGGNS